MSHLKAAVPVRILTRLNNITSFVENMMEHAIVTMEIRDMLKREEKV